MPSTFDGWIRPLHGRGDILLVGEPQTLSAARRLVPFADECRILVIKTARAAGFEPEAFAFTTVSPPLPVDATTERRRAEHVKQFAPSLLAEIERYRPSCVVPLGNLACRAIFGRAVQIGKVRGLLHQVGELRVFPTLAPSAVLRHPEHEPVFLADFSTLRSLSLRDWRSEQKVERDYRWVFDLAPELERFRPGVVAIDTETTGVDLFAGDRVLTVQMSFSPGHGIVLPVDAEYCRRWFPDFADSDRLRLIDQIRAVLRDPAIKKIGFNIKFDHQALQGEPIRTRTEGWLHDAQMMAWSVNEDMLRKDLAECVRVWVPELAGYSDEFDRTVDKSRMIDVPPVDRFDDQGQRVELGMLDYAAGDVDACFRLAKALRPILTTDQRLYRRYQLIHVPALLAFADTVERYGNLIDQERLERLGEELRIESEKLYRELIEAVPRAVKRKHVEAGKPLSFTRDEFLRDILFSAEGFGLRPVLFTAATAELPESQRVPQVGKDHLTYFLHDRRAGDFCRKLRAYSEVEKMRSTYTGSREQRTGFWKYIQPDGRIRPTYVLHRTNTGRTASSNPNGQNYPKRGRFAKPFLSLFRASPGYVLVDCDLSQIELRVVAWMSGDPTMLAIYREGGDIHTLTAARTLHWSYDAMTALARERGDALLADLAADVPGAGDYLRTLPSDMVHRVTVKDYVKLQRFRAKAVNFGFIYGMSARKFRIYAKTDYELDYSEAEAEEVRRIFFETFPALPAWHERQRREARETGMVRALHGGVRHLPSIRSDDPQIRAMAERQAINAPVQGFASDLTLIAMIRLVRNADPEVMRPIMMIHDNLVTEVREEFAREAPGWLRWIQETPPLREWFGIVPPLPIVAEPSIGPDLGNMTELPDAPAVRPPWWRDVH